jgi:hypothetical protein
MVDELLLFDELLQATFKHIRQPCWQVNVDLYIVDSSECQEEQKVSDGTADLTPQNAQTHSTMRKTLRCKIDTLWYQAGSVGDGCGMHRVACHTAVGCVALSAN